MSRKKRRNKSHTAGANAEALRQRHHTTYNDPPRLPLLPSSHSHKPTGTNKLRLRRPKKMYRQRDPNALRTDLGDKEASEDHGNPSAFMIQTPNFARLVEQLTEEAMKKLEHEGQCGWEGAALDMLQEVTEAHLVGFFEDVTLCAKLSNIVTVQERHVKLARRLFESADAVGLTVGIPGEKPLIEATTRGSAQPESGRVVNVLPVRSKRMIDNSMDTD